MNFSRLPACAAISVFVLLGGLVVMTIAWGMIFPGRIYLCTDSVMPGIDFLLPGSWVHEPIAYVGMVDPSAPMGQDFIRSGWTVTKLWWAWWGMLGVAVIPSLMPITVCLLRRRGAEGDDGPR